MVDLLDEVIQAHGGLDRWRSVNPHAGWSIRAAATTQPTAPFLASRGRSSASTSTTFA
jgi:hypothetical protein